MFNKVDVAKEKLLKHKRKDDNYTTYKQERKIIFDFTRALVFAQFKLADQELTKRLWKDVAHFSLDEERILYLMYRCAFHDDEAEMIEVDLKYIKKKS